MPVIKDAIKDNKKILLLALGLLVVSVVGMLYLNQSPNNMITPLPDSNRENPELQEPEQVLKEGIDYKALIRTSMGDIELDLFELETPITVNSFVYLTQQDFYNNTAFHRVIDGFVIQGGDPKGDGTGGPGYEIVDEITNRKFESYTLGMANAGPNTNGSQFFITSGNIPKESLDVLSGNYTVFGKVTKGFTVVDSIEKVKTDSNDKPHQPVKVEEITIIEN